MPATFDDLIARIGTGIYIELIDIEFPHNVISTSISWTETKPAGATITLETNISLDGGNTWLGWQTCTNGGVIPDITKLVTDLSNAQMQIRVTMSTTGWYLPSVDSISFTITAGYKDESYWLSPSINLMGITYDNSSVSWVENLAAGTSIKVYERCSYDEENWSAWTEISSGDTINTDFWFKQYKVSLFSDAVTRENTPELQSLSVSADTFSYDGIWTSPTIDLSFAEDVSTAKISVDYSSGDAGTGSLILLSQESSDGVTWNTAQSVLGDGTIVGTDNYIRIYAILRDGAELDGLTVYVDGDVAVTLLKDSLTMQTDYDFTILRDKLIIVNGKDSPLQWNGTDATTSLLGGSPPVMTMVETHHNRVWGIEAANTSRLRFSDALDPETWDALNFFDFNPEDGDVVTALIRYGHYLIVSKQRSMAILTGNSDTTYGITWLDTAFGAMGQRAIYKVDNFLVYVAYDGIRTTDLVDPKLLSKDLEPDWEGINHRRLSAAAVTYWKNKIYVALPKMGSLYNNVVWCYNVVSKSWAIYDEWCVSHWLGFKQYGSEVLLAADSQTGQVYEVMYDPFDGDESIEYDVITKEFDFDSPERYKVFKTVFVELEGVEEESTFEMDMYVDDTLKGTYTATIPAGTGTKYVKRVLPPVYDAVLGRTFTLGFKGKCTIQGISIVYVTKGLVATEEDS